MQTRITEIFYSISGEGMSVGIPTVFVRFAGCSLRCGISEGRKLWCDTGYSLSFQTGEWMSLDSVLEKIDELNPKAQIILTGGEPLEGEEKRKFCAVLSKTVRDKRHNSHFAQVRIETAGKESIEELPDNVFTLDYKLPGSGMESYMRERNFHYLRERKNSLDEVKFVIRDEKDFKRALEVVDLYSLYTTELLFSPVAGEMEPSLLAEWVKSIGLPNVRLSLQLHKILWGERRGV